MEVEKFTLDNLKSKFQINGFNVEIIDVVIYYDYSIIDYKKILKTIKDIFETLEEENTNKFIEVYRVLEKLHRPYDIKLNVLIDNNYKIYEEFNYVIYLLSNCEFIEKVYPALSDYRLEDILKRVIENKIEAYYKWEKRPHYLRDKIFEEIKYLLDDLEKEKFEKLQWEHLLNILFYFFKNYDYTKVPTQDDVVIKLYKRVQQGAINAGTFFSLFTAAIIEDNVIFAKLDNYIRGLKKILYYDKKLNWSKQIDLRNLDDYTNEFLTLYLFLPIVYDNSFLLKKIYNEVLISRHVYAIYEKGYIKPFLSVLKIVNVKRYKEVADVFYTAPLVSFNILKKNRLKKVTEKIAVPII